MKIISQGLVTVYKFLFLIMGRILPKKNNIIIFESFLGKQYSDNPRAIYEFLKTNYPHYKMYWSVDEKHIKSFKDHDLNIIIRFTPKWMYLMNRAKYWVINSRLPVWIPKPKDTIYIQTWHGTPLKKLANDMEDVLMPGTDIEKYKSNFLKEVAKWDYLISPNKYSTKAFKTAFKFDKDIMEIGYPRNDYLINKNNAKEIERIKGEVGIPKNKKIILYAPTWRDNQYYSVGSYKFKMNLDLDLLKRELSGEYILIIRAHYLISRTLDLTGYGDFVYDLSNHSDIRELYLISDILITDYSSVFFDFAILKKPMIFYAYDLDEYRDKIRGFYLDFEKEAPGPIVKSTEKIVEALKEVHRERNKKLIEKFHNEYCYLEDGKASERIVKAIILE